MTEPSIGALRLAPLLYLVCFSFACRAQDAPVEQVNWRYDEDWSKLRGRDPATLPGWATVKYQPLDSSGSIWISTGLEARMRYEGARISRPVEVARDDNVVWVRFLPHADLHAGPVRAFIQGIAGYAPSLERTPGPTDSTGIDLTQAFAEAKLPLGTTTLTVRAGRQLIALGSERLLTARYGPNIPQPFDGYRAILTRANTTLSAFDFRAVAIGPGTLDDRTSDTRRIAGAYLTSPITGGLSADVYWLTYRNAAARYNQGAGAEQRGTAGLRMFGHAGRWSWNWEAILQWGHIGATDISAWSLATETGYSLRALPLHPKLTVRANIASGDRDPADRRLQTFTAMFPRGKYFGELSPVGPQNIVNLHGRLDFSLARNLSAGISVEGYWRHRTGDGVYNLQGGLLQSGYGTGARYIGTQEEAVLGWSPSAIWAFTASLSRFSSGALRSPGSLPRTLTQLGLEARLRI